jgi:hypothetical protein
VAFSGRKLLSKLPVVNKASHARDGGPPINDEVCTQDSRACSHLQNSLVSLARQPTLPCWKSLSWDDTATRPFVETAG